MKNEQQLVLVAARKSRGGQHWNKDDYDVRLLDPSGPVIGRIFKPPQAPKDRPYFWTITAVRAQLPTERGYTATREEAMAAFKSAWGSANRR